MDDLDQDIRATAESIEAGAARLTEIEAEKQRLDADDPRMLELSAEAERIAKELGPKTGAERQLVREKQAERAPGTI